MTTARPSDRRRPADAATTSDAATLLISLSEVAALARVKRPVVSMWRTRFSSGTMPFPRPRISSNGRDRFSAVEVAQWLCDTNHGNNPDAVADAAAFALVDSLALTETQHADALGALLALRAFDGRPLLDGDLIARADEADPDDEILAREIASVDASWAAFADQMADAAYSTLGAWERLHERRPASGRDGSAGALSAQGGELITGLSRALLDDDRPMIADAPGALSAHDTVATVIASFGESTEVEVHVPAGDAGRSIRRELLVRGLYPLLSQRPPGGAAPAVHLARLRGWNPEAELAQLEELVVELGDAQRAIVIGPDTLLTEPIFGTSEASRDAVLRSGRVRGILRLPQGMVVTAPRQAMAIWLIGGPQGGTPLADRFTLTGDLRGIELNDGRTRDVISDLVTSLGTRRDVLAHAFRFLRFVRTSSLLAGNTPLVATSALPRLGANGPAPADLPVLLDEATARLEIDLPLRTTTTPAAPASVSLGDAIDAGDVRALSGARLSVEDSTGADGFDIIGRDEVQRVARVRRQIDRLRLAASYPRAEITRPGDVVFLAGASPRALVDGDGASVVEYPARILRLASHAFVPEIVAADINAQGGSSPWQRWMLRRVEPSQHDATRDALHRVSALRADADRRAAELAALESLVIDALAAGVVTAEPVPHDPSDETSEPDTTLDSNTEGTS